VPLNIAAVGENHAGLRVADPVSPVVAIERADRTAVAGFVAFLVVFVLGIDKVLAVSGAEADRGLPNLPARVTVGEANLVLLLLHYVLVWNQRRNRNVQNLTALGPLLLVRILWP